jgi:hypothetical protein
VDKNSPVFLGGFFSAPAILGGQQGGALLSGRYGAEPRPHINILILILNLLIFIF